jgi:hypothetical protein
MYPIFEFYNRNFFWTPFREGAKPKEISDLYVILGYTLKFDIKTEESGFHNTLITYNIYCL